MVGWNHEFSCLWGFPCVWGTKEDKITFNRIGWIDGTMNLHGFSKLNGFSVSKWAQKYRKTWIGQDDLGKSWIFVDPTYHKDFSVFLSGPRSTERIWIPLDGSMEPWMVAPWPTGSPGLWMELEGLSGPKIHYHLESSWMRWMDQWNLSFFSWVHHGQSSFFVSVRLEWT